MVSSFIGRTLGKYEIVEVLGHGGMASVYKGYQREVDRYAALKVLPPHPGRDPLFVERFRLEARTIARLQHPHILTLYDYGNEDEILYLAMAFVDGGSLRDLIVPGGMPLAVAEKLLREVGGALDYAHRQGVIHRDIKPANILVNREGHTLLADFGIAKLTNNASTLTGTGGVVGTPAYMAPEQSQGEIIDQRADIYALGVVVFEMLTGRKPYESPNALRLIMMHINEPIPSVTHARNGLPPALEAVMWRVLAKTPDERYQTTAEFCDAFSRAIHGDESHTALVGQERAGAAWPEAQPTAILTAEQGVISPTRTFLLCGVEDSTQLWERYPQEMGAALVAHDGLVSSAIAAQGGRIYKTVGDSTFAIFESADGAYQAALMIGSRAKAASRRVPLAARMSLHSGEAEERARDYFGATINRALRLLEAARGGQILVSGATRDLLPPDAQLRDLGTHRLRNLSEPEHIYQALSPEMPLNAEPIRTLTLRPTHLPAQLTSFVGREQMLAEVAALLRQPNVRLLTLLGPGGIGKTRLSIQVGGALLDEYEDGVFFVPLAPFSQMDAAIKFVAQLLNVQEDSATPPLEAVKAYLQPRQILLIFDNFEHLLDAAPVLNELLAAAARVRILVTSRESLFIYGEHTRTVPPLSLPEPGQTVERLRQSSAVTLFVERVQAMRSEFVLTDANADDVVRICRQLDGLPLALELAAARVRDLTLDDIAEGITQRLALLSKGPRDLPPRQQTMRGAIEWSYHLLSADERRAFARFAVFEGSFLAESAAAVAGIADLERFTHKSLLQETAAGVFSMLAVLREYAAERLADFGETAALRDAHSVYYCAWLERAQAHLNGRDQIEWYGRLQVEHYNLHAALGWLLERQLVEDAGRMVAVLWRYWATQSLLSEGGQWIDRVLAQADQLSAVVQAGATQGAGRLALLRHDYARATAFQQRSLALYETVADLAGQAAVLLSLGETEYVQGNHIQAENYLGEGLAIFRLLNNEAGVGRCLNIMGKIVMQNGDFAKAEPLLVESLALARAHGNSEAVALALYDLAGVLRAQEKYAEAEEHYRESLALYRELNLAVGVGTMLYNLGFTLQALGDQAGAMGRFLDALDLLHTLDEPIAIAECLIGIAGAFLRLDQRRLCIKTLSAANAILTPLNALGQVDYVDLQAYERIYEASRADEMNWQEAWDAGQTTPLESIFGEIFAEAQPGAA